MRERAAKQLVAAEACAGQPGRRPSGLDRMYAEADVGLGDTLVVWQASMP